ncbi:unnamed protein product [Adineta steineri]|uniref:BTB domain-containing protein n=1 Tax=Adineta steineri TaxID=433720 RepID=A0A816CK66_9BILA|nr:unnamed protein product [Adineta steineri]CAF1624477.1 unnamed protein product [Adineta steineri]
MLNTSTIQSNTDDKSHLFESTSSKYTRHSTIRKQVITNIPVDDNESAAIEIQENKPMLSSVVNTSNDNLPLHCISTECSTSNDSSHTGNNRIILNVGGIKHEVMWRTLARLPYTRLGRLAELRQSTILLSCPISHDELLRLCDDYDLSNGEFFFDRSSRSFTSIINFYRTGKLHLVDDICVISFHDDLIYWGIEECYLELCCLNKYYQKKEYVLDEIKKESELTQVEKHDIFGQGYCSNIKRKIWDLVEHPQTSIAARIIVFISIAFILLSTLTLIIGTIEGIGCTPNMTNIEMNEEQTSSNHRISQQDKIPDECNEPLFLFLIELICISWFTIEYIIRIFTTPNRCKFLKSLLNIIDLIAIVPFYISITLETIYMDNIKDLQSVRKTVQVFRVLRIVRILKLARYSTDLQSLGYTLKRSSKELFMLLMFLGISILLFSSLAYYAEKDGNALQFRSIPHAFWWAIVVS